MKNILIIACVLFFVGPVLSQTPGSVNEDFKESQITDLTNNDLGEALVSGYLTIKFGQMHEAFRENPRVLAEAVTTNNYVAQTFRSYAMTNDESEKRILEERLLELYN
ncbi:MAG: hypothetical protein KJO29_10985 [Bacteroidia bacterium]|nr:hypothetical protein [Bacteroidia bacterium]